MSQQTTPCDAASCTVYWAINSYDALNRLTRQQRPISASNSTPQYTNMAYAGRTTVITDPQSKVTTQTVKVTGDLGRSQDHNGYYQNFGHDAFGSLISVTDSLANPLFTATYDYGLAAFQRTTTDMDAGGWSYNYNALGEITYYTDAKGQNITFGAFDLLGRPTTRTEPDLTTTWTWGNSAASYNIGRLASVTTSGGTSYTESFAYDSKGRLSNGTKQSQPFDFAYNTQGTLDTLTYPTSTSTYRLKLKYVYQNGVLQKVQDFNSTTVFWFANATNPIGQVTQETLGNRVVTNRSFDAVTGWMSTTQAAVGGGTGLQNQSYVYDLVGNVTQRQDINFGLTESFCYDNVYRLDHSTLTNLCTGTTNLQMTYDAMGNISSRGDIAGGAAWTQRTSMRCFRLGTRVTPTPTMLTEMPTRAMATLSPGPASTCPVRSALRAKAPHSHTAQTTRSGHRPTPDPPEPKTPLTSASYWKLWSRTLAQTGDITSSPGMSWWRSTVVRAAGRIRFATRLRT